MKLRDVLMAVSGATDIRIYAGCLSLYHGKMCNVNKTVWSHLGDYLDREVMNLSTDEDAIIILID